MKKFKRRWVDRKYLALKFFKRYIYCNHTWSYTHITHEHSVKISSTTVSWKCILRWCEDWLCLKEEHIKLTGKLAGLNHINNIFEHYLEKYGRKDFYAYKEK